LNEDESFESELKSLQPAWPPAEFLARLSAAKPATVSVRDCQSRPPCSESMAYSFGFGAEFWRRLLRWAIPAAAGVAIGAVVWRVALPPPAPSGLPDQAAVASPELNADDVRIGRELVASFDAVGRLPGGEPVRFRCQEWRDEVIWRDTTRGVTVKKQTPRLEVVPVRFETY